MTRVVRSALVGGVAAGLLAYTLSALAAQRVDDNFDPYAHDDLSSCWKLPPGQKTALEQAVAEYESIGKLATIRVMNIDQVGARARELAQENGRNRFRYVTLSSSYGPCDGTRQVFLEVETNELAGRSAAFPENTPAPESPPRTPTPRPGFTRTPGPPVLTGEVDGGCRGSSTDCYGRPSPTWFSPARPPAATPGSPPAAPRVDPPPPPSAPRADPAPVPTRPAPDRDPAPRAPSPTSLWTRITIDGNDEFKRRVTNCLDGMWGVAQGQGEYAAVFRARLEELRTPGLDPGENLEKVTIREGGVGTLGGETWGPRGNLEIPHDAVIYINYNYVDYLATEKTGRFCDVLAHELAHAIRRIKGERLTQPVPCADADGLSEEEVAAMAFENLYRHLMRLPKKETYETYSGFFNLFGSFWPDEHKLPDYVVNPRPEYFAPRWNAVLGQGWCQAPSSP